MTYPALLSQNLQPAGHDLRTVHARQDQANLGPLERANSSGINRINGEVEGLVDEELVLQSLGRGVFVVIGQNAVLQVLQRGRVLLWKCYRVPKSVTM